ncbi:hypothetical protein MBLNU457_6083t1 [Dothideomycetes sp. NU457]
MGCRASVKLDDDQKPSYTGLATRKSPKAKNSKSGDNGNGDGKSKTPEALTPEQWRARREKNLKLLADLFPSEAKRFRAQAREVPRLPLAPPTAPANPVIRREFFDSDASRLARRAMKQQGMDSSLLVLRNASKNLTLEDFQRLIPRGKHLEGWTLAVGDIVKVIPGRDLATLERQNYYYILFSSPLSAFTYQSRATKISRLVQSRTPKGPASPLGPGPGELVDGEDVHDLMQSYTLTPPSQQISLRQLAPPLSTIAEQISRCHGYADLVERPNRSPFEVLLRFEGVNPGHTLLNSIIKRAEYKRGIPWTGEVLESYTLTKWEHSGEVQSPLSHVRSKGYVLPDNEDPVKDEEGEAEGERKYDMVPRNDYERDEEERIAQRARRTPASSFIVGLQTQAEASAFARYWHKRVLMEGTIRNGSHQETAPMVSAEVLW